jgi:hypothetical protein
MSADQKNKRADKVLFLSVLYFLIRVHPRKSAASLLCRQLGFPCGLALSRLCLRAPKAWTSALSSKAMERPETGDHQ